jgi:hypothetical protein
MVKLAREALGEDDAIEQDEAVNPESSKTGENFELTRDDGA